MLKFELTSDPKRLPEVRERVRGWIEGHDWPERQVGEIVLALDEAVTNIIRHGYEGDPRQRILVCAEVFDDPEQGQGVEIRVRDFGKQVDPERICGRDLDDVRPGGLGVHIIRALNSSVEYQRAEGGGMLLIMRKFKTHSADYGGQPTEH
ncbi:MAG: ATP-binding protein [Phycisphaerae bacterium]|nr:ATP-binding protein [Phycisphaerae bacterium]